MKPKTIGILGLSMMTILWGCGASDNAATGSMAMEAASPEMKVRSGEAKSEMELASFETQIPAMQRSIIRTGYMTVYVNSVEEKTREVRELIRGVGGYIQDDDVQRSKTSAPKIQMTLRFPVSEFDRLMDEFEGLGWLESRSSSEEDVTEQLVDLGVRIRAAEAEETAYLGIMTTAKKVEDVLKVQHELSDVRERIERMEAQQLSLTRRVALSTVHLNLFQDDIIPSQENPSWVKESMAGSIGALRSFGRAVGSTVIFLVVISPIWGIPALIIWWIIRRKRQKHAAQPTG